MDAHSYLCPSVSICVHLCSSVFICGDTHSILRVSVADPTHHPGVTNFTHTGAPTLTVLPVGVSAPVFWSMRKTTRLSEP
jgi:hypothetical protein